MGDGVPPRAGGLDPRLAAAVNNARWCDLVCRTHGTMGTFAADAWTNPVRTPPYYPDAVTLTPTADTQSVLARIDTATPGASIKDSFNDQHQLGTAGFTPLFDASWLCHPGSPSARVAPTNRDWRTVDDVATLSAWSRAGTDVPDLFRPALLTDAHTRIFACLDSHRRIVGGAVAFTSDGVIGLSNVFAIGIDLDAVWAGAVAAVSASGAPVVGYEHGDDLTVARGLGFGAIGGLRIWVQSTL